MKQVVNRGRVELRSRLRHRPDGGRVLRVRAIAKGITVSPWRSPETVDMPHEEWLVSDEKMDRGRATSFIPWATGDWQILDTETELRHRLANATSYFRRKTSAVLNDDTALRLLADIHDAGVVAKSDFDPCEHGFALAKLTAANLCEIGADVIYITPVGRRLVKKIETA